MVALLPTLQSLAMTGSHPPDATARDVIEMVTELRATPEGWWAVLGIAGAVATCWAVVWMYRNEGRSGASWRARLAAAVLRCVVLVALLVVLLDPARVRILRRWTDSYALVLLDNSSSMGLTDRYPDADRAARITRAWGTEPNEPVRRIDLLQRVVARDDQKLLLRLAERNRVKVFAFSDEPDMLGMIRTTRDESRTAPPGEDGIAKTDGIDIRLDATGAVTDADRTIRRAVQSAGSAPIAGVILLTDGGFNHGAPSEEIARYARERHLAIHTVGIGDPTPLRNVRLLDVDAPKRVFRQDPFEIAVRLSSEHMDGETVEVRVSQREASGRGEGTVVATRSVTIAEGGRVELPDRPDESIAFPHRQDRPGRYLYTVEVPAQSFESVVEDNVQQTAVTVVDASTRVLLVSATPSWEYRFLSRMLQRDPTFDVSCWLQSADVNAVRDGDTIIDHLPRLPEELLVYDVVVLMDPDPSEFDEPWCQLLDTLVVDRGGGFLLTAGRSHTPRLLRDALFTDLVDLLPVSMDPEVDLTLNRIGHYQLSPSPVEVPPAAMNHAVIRTGDGRSSDRLVDSVTCDVYWHYPVLREKPAATVLMRHGHPAMRNEYGAHVLAAVQFVGAGRTGFIGFDGTWRWRRDGVERFNQFWVRLLRYLAEGKLLGGADRGSIVTHDDQFSLGEAVPIVARLLDERYEPLDRDQVDAVYTVAGRRHTLPLRAQPGRPGWFEGRFTPGRIGTYQITLTVPDASGRGSVDLVHDVRVVRPNLEIMRPRMARDEMIALSQQSDGGAYFEVDELDRLVDAIPDLHEETSVRSRPTRLWDNETVLILLIALLCGEWIIRKWGRLL